MANPLITTLRSLRGNPRACVYTEPLWGISMNLCLPYASVYMLALGIDDVRLGFISTVGMLCQVVFGSLSGVITDKIGRRTTTAVFDLIAWCIPCLIWFSVSLVDSRWAFWFFLGASVINSTLQVTQNSWDCLLAEDAEREDITRIYSLIAVAGQMSAIFAPIAAVLVAQYSLVPAVRILYANAFIVMTVKVVWLYLWSHETEMGVKRKAETHGVSIAHLLAGYVKADQDRNEGVHKDEANGTIETCSGEQSGVIRLILHSPGTIFALVVGILFAAVSTVNGTFWQVLANKKLMVPTALLPIFAMGRSIIAMVFLFTIVHRITKTTNLKVGLLIGFLAYGVGQTILCTIPGPSGQAGVATYVLLCTSLLCDGLGVAILATLAESIVALNIDKQERSRVMAVQRTMVMLCVSPFGWIGGWLSSISRSLPFVLTACILALGIIATLVHYRRRPV